MDYDTPSFLYFHILFIGFFSSIFFHRITRSYRNILAPRITHGFSRIFGRWPLANAVAFLL